MSFTRKPYATPVGATTFTEVSHTVYTQLDWTRKAGFAISFYVRVLTQAAEFLCSQMFLCPVGYSFECGFPLTFDWAVCGSFTTIKTSQMLHPETESFKQPADLYGSRLVRWISATSYAFFTVSHQNGFSSSFQSASNLLLVRITYLYGHSVL